MGRLRILVVDDDSDFAETLGDSAEGPRMPVQRIPDFPWITTHRERMVTQRGELRALKHPIRQCKEHDHVGS